MLATATARAAVLGATLAAAHAVAAADAPAELTCPRGEGCEVICHHSGAADVTRSVVIQRSGVARVRVMGRSWLEFTVHEAAQSVGNHSGVVRLADGATCWFERMQARRAGG